MRRPHNLKIVELALAECSGSSFEQYAQTICAQAFGIKFSPLGGVHDGGADGFEGGLLGTEKPTHFFQMSVQDDFRAKIKHTVQRLRESERDPKQVTYVTNRPIPLLDREEEALSEELSVIVRIRDQKWLLAHANDNEATITAFDSYLAKYIAFLREIGAANTIEVIDNKTMRTLCVFLGQEVDRRRGNTDLLEAVTDSLILWALEGTDPDKQIFRNKTEILQKIEEALPRAKDFIRGVIDTRLANLSQKHEGRQIRHHRKLDSYCLPFETRELVEEENAEDELLKYHVLEIFAQRAGVYLAGTDSKITTQSAAAIAHRAIELSFHLEGLEFAAFLTDKEEGHLSSNIADQIDRAIEQYNVVPGERAHAKAAATKILRTAFYESTIIERDYFGKLCRTYTLLFSLQNEPKIVEYFRSMKANFVLYVGADILIRALSEHFLPDEDKMLQNLLRILKAAGATLILSEKSLEEVHSHLKGTDLEFQNYFVELEPYMDLEIVRHAPKILIRSYFYAKLKPAPGVQRPAGWKSFIGQFCSYQRVHTLTGREELRLYLCQKFTMEYESTEAMEKTVNEEELEDLTQRVRAVKVSKEKEDILAYNDALQVLRIYSKREELEEQMRPSPFGYRTWWLTHESRIRQATQLLTAKKHARYIIRPEFLLNFIQLSPKLEEVQKSFDTIFPSILGVRLSNRLNPEVFQDALTRLKEIKGKDEARVLAEVSTLSNQLMGDKFKQYEKNYDDYQH